MKSLNNKKDIKSMSLEEIQVEFKKKNFEKYRAFQVFEWLSRGVTDFNQMSNISIKFKEFLDENYFIAKCCIKKKFISNDETVKYILSTNDNECIEAVLMKYKYGHSVCISTQIGCKIGCKFCANCTLGFVRNLSASEMLSQVHVICDDLKQKVSNITLMGIGEPFDNYENTIKFLKIVTFEKGFNIGARHISVSTCGICDKIKKFADEKLGVSLSVSLHSCDDSVRDLLMPINKKFKIKKIIDSCRYYIKKTRKRVTFEYIMIENLNDSLKDAEKLGELIKGLNSHVNIIPINYVDKNFYKPSSKEIIKSFSQILINMKISVTIRRTLGSDVKAACGQLRRSVI